MNRDIIRLHHIIDACSAIEEDIKSGDKDRKTRQAIERNLEIIGEAGRVISDELKERYTDIPWRNIIGFRNILAHEYFVVDEPTVWDVAEHKIPALRNWIEGIIKENNEL